MGIRINVFRTAGYDCTNGPSRDFDKLTVINVDGPFDPSDDAPAVVLEPGALAGTAILKPVFEDDAPWVMFGGNYGGASDSRFSRAIEAITGSRFYGAVPIHDRVE